MNNQHIFNNDRLKNCSDEDLKQRLAACENCIIYSHKTPSCYHYSDVASFYLEAALVGESLAKIDTNIKLEIKNHLHGTTFNFSLKSDSTSQLVDVLRKVEALTSPDSIEDPFDHAESLYSFLDIAICEQIAFPDLVDSYFANYLLSFDDLSDADKKDLYSEHPEWAYHCWKSSFSTKFDFPLYTSPSFWIMPANSDYRQALNYASDIDSEGCSTERIQDFFITKETVCLLGAGKTVIFPEKLHLQLLEVASLLFPAEGIPGSHLWAKTPAYYRFLLSNNRDFLACEGETFTYILFRNEFSFASKDNLAILKDTTADLNKKLAQQAGFLLEYKCNWEKLDDERFECVCYDLLRRDGRFNHSTIHKMGLAKARDGGRDITAYTHARVGGSSQKWLIQCKHYLSKKSLGRNDVILSELIDEYTPDGVIIATNLIVDSGTYDKYKRIGETREVEVEIWSWLEIERKINENPDLFKFYFCNCD